MEHPMWWSGPRWLKTPEATWMQTGANIQIDSNLCSNAAFTTTLIHSPAILEKYSSLTKLIRVIATCLRFIHNCKYPTQKQYGALHVDAYNKSKQVCIRITQQTEFKEEISHLTSQLPISTKSKLCEFNPFIDEQNIIRIGGRLDNSNLSYDQKHQILLPAKSHLTKLIIHDAHLRTEHGGTQLVINLLRKQFWILNARNEVKAITHKCIACHKFRNIFNEQIMGSLPKSRITPSRPFSNVGIDYAGPINIKASKLRTNKTYKAYIALFVCFATKATHIELVTELTAQAFLAAFNRFSARRGLPSHIYSDNGTNFIGANKIIKKEYAAMLKDSQITNHLTNKSIAWHFIPPRSPHFGGLWEAGVKSTKKHLHKIIDTTLLHYEELNTVLIQIEACLNSRPLIRLTDSHDDFSALTPGHFLIGSEIIAPPAENLLDVNINHLTRWKLLSKLHQDFWKRWSNEYLTTLQQRYKWRIIKQEAQVGDMVLLKEDGLPPTKWRLCRIAKIHPGDDGHVRVVTLTTPTGKVKSAIRKICPLPIDDNMPKFRDV